MDWLFIQNKKHHLRYIRTFSSSILLYNKNLQMSIRFSKNKKVKKGDNLWINNTPIKRYLISVLQK